VGISGRNLIRAHSSNNSFHALVPSPITKTNRILPLLSELTAIQSLNARFENLAGRSAMLGFLVAAITESLLPGEQGQGLFGNLQDVGVLLAFATVLVSIAAFSATRNTTHRLGLQFLEAVITSLTSPTRSTGSVTNTNVDSALDSAFDMVFNRDFLSRVFRVGEEFYFDTEPDDSDFE